MKRLLILAGFTLSFMVAAVSPSAAAATSDAVCEQKIATINYRSELLEVYRKESDAKYQTTHKKWANYISYAGQWVPKDAEKTRASLYAYDTLHAKTNQEVDKQIAANRYLEKQPLTCAAGMRSLVDTKLNEIAGLKGKKAVSGNALIAHNNAEETAYFQKDFKNSTNRLIARLHKAKLKHQQPSHPQTTVR